MANPSGLQYNKKVLSSSVYRDIMSWLARHDDDFFPVSNASGKSSSSGRRVLHYGYSYDYSSGSSSGTAPRMPKIIRRIRRRILRSFPDLVDSKRYWNQCIINRYLPGQGIGAHIDVKSYGDHIVCFTLGSGREMEFTQGSKKYCLYTEPRSAYVMSGESRYDWKHQMRSRKSDSGVSRSVCYSITFRHV